MSNKNNGFRLYHKKRKKYLTNLDAYAIGMNGRVCIWPKKTPVGLLSQT